LKATNNKGYKQKKFLATNANSQATNKVFVVIIRRERGGCCDISFSSFLDFSFFEDENKIVESYF
jgi:hypothetical protein